MRIIDRYVVRELLPPFILGLGGFLVILVGDVLYTLAEYIASGRVSLDVVLRLLAYKMPAIMVITFPVSTLFGTLLGLGRLARDCELQAMRLMGMSLPRLFAPVIAFGLGITGLTLATNEVISPWANQRANALIRRALLGEAFPEVREQIFLRAPGNRVLYVNQIDREARVLRDVMIFESEGPLPRLITAKRAQWSTRTWVLHHGVLRELDAEGFTAYEATFATLQITVGLDASGFFEAQRTPEEMTIRELRSQVDLFRAGLPPRAMMEYHRKFAVPAASVVFAFVAAPLSLLAMRGGRFAGVAASVVLLFVYYVLMSVARALGATGVLSPLLAAWAPNLSFLAAGIILVAWADGWIRLPAPMVAAARPQGARP
ncbi:MAG: LptF/LptG family permease [Armatimonadota bacterium]|nr:LptF/LptG family permease [Armatimonadota bacterium]MDR7520687.1 LptF/LptG family permease [Armatimonadota bacterium]MDR7548548.1 LptF/LptG family permease [Armatimonadota bacterium]